MVGVHGEPKEAQGGSKEARGGSEEGPRRVPEVRANSVVYLLAPPGAHVGAKAAQGEPQGRPKGGHWGPGTQLRQNNWFDATQTLVMLILKGPLGTLPTGPERPTGPPSGFQIAAEIQKVIFAKRQENKSKGER